MTTFKITAVREITIAYRRRMTYLNPLFFFLLVALLFPLTIIPDPAKLAAIGPGVVWVALLFANMLSIENLFGPDFQDGTLEQVVLNVGAWPGFILAKLSIHWLTITLPLIFVSLLIAKLFFLPSYAIQILFVSLLLGSLTLTLLCSLGAALLLSLPNQGILLLLLIGPLYLPVLIFGAGAVNDAVQNLPIASQLCFLAAFLSLSATFVPLAISSALKMSLE